MEPSTSQIRLPWTGNKRTDYLIPCIQCRTESIAISAGLCKNHLDEKVRELITNSILK